MLPGQGLITDAQLDAAVAQQHRDGGRLGADLVALGALRVDQMLTALRNQREAGAALELCEQTMHKWRAVYGPNHPNTNRARYNLARALFACGHTAASLSHAEAASTGLLTAVGPDHA